MILHAAVAVLLLGSQFSLSAAQPKLSPEEKAAADVAEQALLREISALWEKVGLHAEKGTKLAKDNRSTFEIYYRNAAKQVSAKKENPNRELLALMCMPCAYGWPMSRTFGKDIKYTGLVPIIAEGEYEVMMDVSPKTATAKVVLEVDGKALDQVVTTNKKVTVQLKAGVRALSVRTDEDVRLHFLKVDVDRVLKK